MILVIYSLNQKKDSIKDTKKELAKQAPFLKQDTLDNEIKKTILIVQKELDKEKPAEKQIPIPPLPSKVAQMMELYQQKKEDPTITLKISDLSPTEQALQQKWLNNYNQKGYIQTGNVSFDYIQSKNELVELVKPNPSSISIPLQDISTTKLSEYEYLGKVLNTENTTPEQNKLDSEIKRAFKGRDGQKFFLLEKSVQSTTAILVDEFITENINGYPASRMTYCTEDQRCMSQITLITKDKLYEVSTYGDQNSTKDQLVGIISSFDLPELNPQ